MTAKKTGFLSAAEEGGKERFQPQSINALTEI
jgi:hypothetical protein